MLPLEGENLDDDDEHAHAGRRVQGDPGARRAGHQAIECAGTRPGCQPVAGTARGGRGGVCSWSWSSISHAWPKLLIASMIGSIAAPFGVSSYSTRGGDSGKLLRETIPSCSS